VASTKTARDKTVSLVLSADCDREVGSIVIERAFAVAIKHDDCGLEYCRAGVIGGAAAAARRKAAESARADLHWYGRRPDRAISGG